MSTLYRGPAIDASYQVSIHLDRRFQRRCFRNQPIRNKNFLWRPCLLLDRDKMSDRYRIPSIDASCQVSIHLAKGFQRRRFFFKSANQKQELPVAAMFVKNHDEMSNLYRRPSIDASYQVSVHLANQFQRRRLKQSANQKEDLLVATMFVNGSERNEQSL